MYPLLIRSNNVYVFSLFLICVFCFFCFDGFILDLNIACVVLLTGKYCVVLLGLGLGTNEFRVNMYKWHQEADASAPKSDFTLFGGKVITFWRWYLHPGVVAPIFTKLICIYFFSALLVSYPQLSLFMLFKKKILFIASHLLSYSLCLEDLNWLFLSFFTLIYFKIEGW